MKPYSYHTSRKSEAEDLHQYQYQYRIKQGRQPGICAICGKIQPNTYFEIDHIISFYISGNNTQFNLQILCHTCHKKKTSIDNAVIHLMVLMKYIDARDVHGFKSFYTRDELTAIFMHLREDYEKNHAGWEEYNKL